VERKEATQGGGGGGPYEGIKGLGLICNRPVTHFYSIKRGRDCLILKRRSARYQGMGKKITGGKREKSPSRAKTEETYRSGLGKA